MDQQDANLRNMLQLGIKAAQAKRKTEAYQLLSQVVRRDPRSEQGWLWLAAVAPHPQESLDAFNHVLAINPNNEQARVGQRWAMSRLTAATAPAPAAPAAPQAPLASPARPAAAPPAPPARGGLSSESLATTFAPAGSMPGGNAPAPAGGGRAGLSSESLASLFAPQGAVAAPPGTPPVPAAKEAPVAPVASTAAPPAPPRTEPVAPPAPPRTEPMVPPARPAPAWPESPAPQGGSPTAEIPVGGPAPQAPAAPDDWRAAGDLNVPAGTVNWDDDGADLRSLDDLSVDYAQGVTCPNCGAPGQTGLVCSLCNSPLPQPAPGGIDTLDPSLRGVGYAPEARVAVAPPVARPVEYTAPPVEAPVSPYTETLRPVGRRPSLLPLVLGAALLITGIVVVVYGLLGGNNTRFDQVGQRFFAAHLARQYDAAANYLAPDLRASYLAAHDLPDLNLTTTLAAAPTWTAVGAPLQMAPDGTSGESYVMLTPQGGGAQLLYLVKVTQSGGNWLIQSVRPQAP
ncbi:MAG TPA: hypothetical protein VFM49_11845 [Chloroflexia bacterium]|jgi:hypothetical protein|nr:hypothetical protein [Chloroflexia bacterium]